MQNQLKNLNLVAAAAALLVSVLACVHSFLSPLGLYDEGFALTNAWRLSNGERPHIDYWAAYPAGSAALLALAFKYLAPTLLVSRFVNSAWILLLLGSMFLVLRRTTERWVGALMVAIAAMWVATALYPSYVSTPALAVVLGTLALFGSALTVRSTARAVLAGFLGGSLIVLRHDFAAYLGVSLVISWMVMRWLLGQRDPISVALAGRFLLAFILSLGSCFVVYIYLTDWAEFFDQALVFPATGMREHRLLGVPSFDSLFTSGKALWLSAWLIPLMVMCSLARAPRSLAQLQAVELWTTSVLLLMTCLLTLQSHNRLDMAHLAPSMVLMLTCVGVMWKFWFPGGCTLRTWILAVPVVVFLSYSLLTGARPLISDRIPRCFSGFEAPSCRRSDPRQVEALSFLREHAAPNEAVFVGNTRHDKIWVNDASLYFLLQRPIAVKWNEMHPGVVTSDAVQMQVVGSLERRSVRWAVLVNMPDSQEPNLSSVSSGVTVLDSYLSSRYQTVFSNDKYQVRKLVTSK